MAAPVAVVAAAAQTVAESADSEEVAQMEMMKAMGLPCGFNTTQVTHLHNIWACVSMLD